MAELNLIPAATSSCCSSDEQTVCCEPADKAACCGTAAAGGTCGCAAGNDDIRETVRARYAAAARAASSGSGCCSPVGTADESGTEVFGAALYGADSAGAPTAAVEASLGCGVPTAVADLEDGEIVLDLGSGAGADVLISARRVGPTGRAIGLDMTDEMLELARANARDTGLANAEFIRGYIEQVPLPDASVDVVISNCVLNLAADKHVVLREVARVLRPGGRFAVSDVIADEHMDEATRTDMQQWTGCIAGALTRDEFERAATAGRYACLSAGRFFAVLAAAFLAICSSQVTRSITEPSSARSEATASSSCRTRPWVSAWAPVSAASLDSARWARVSCCTIRPSSSRRGEVRLGQPLGHRGGELRVLGGPDGEQLAVGGRGRGAVGGVLAPRLQHLGPHQPQRPPTTARGRAPRRRRATGPTRAGRETSTAAEATGARRPRR